MKRHQSRNISRNRFKIEALNPCGRYSSSAGVNPFSTILQSSGIADQNKTEEELTAEKHLKHQLKMAADQKSAKARQQRKRNKV